MRKWVCPKCLLLIEARAEEVLHRCPNNKNKYTQFNERENEPGTNRNNVSQGTE
jgi:hypothetical protein